MGAKSKNDVPDAKDRLLRAAIDVLAASGWRAATCREIAKRAQVNLGLINYYYEGKDALLIAALDQAMAQLSAQMPDLKGFPSFAAFARKMMELAIDMAKSPQIKIIFEATLQAPHHPALAELIQNYLSLFRQNLEVALHTLVSQRPQNTAMAIALAALFDGALLHAMIDPQVNMPQSLEMAIGFFLREEQGS